MKIESVRNKFLILLAMTVLFGFILFRFIIESSINKIDTILINDARGESIVLEIVQNFREEASKLDCNGSGMKIIDGGLGRDNLKQIIKSNIYSIFAYHEKSEIRAIKVRAGHGNSFIWLKYPEVDKNKYLNKLDQPRFSKGNLITLKTGRD